jgi:hypothetical protein
MMHCETDSNNFPSPAEILGFDPTVSLKACCGAPGDSIYNYNPNITCGRPGSNECGTPSNPGPGPDQYQNWDGIHFTEAVNRIIAKFALSGQFTDGGVNYTASCDLDFTKFGNVTFKEAYPLQFCNNLYT